MLTRTQARKIALSLPGTSEKPYFSKPSVFAGEEFLMRVHDKEDAIALRVGSMEMRDVMLEAEPKLFYITDHYKNFPFILARLSALDTATLKQLLTGRIAQIAARPPKKKKKIVIPGERRAAMRGKGIQASKSGKR